MATIPARILKANVYIGEMGQELLAGGGSVELPTIAMMTDSIDMAGGEVDLPSIGLTESMELGVTVNAPGPHLMKMSRPGSQLLIVRAAMQVADSSTHSTRPQPLKVEARGLIKELALGSANSGEKTDSSATFELTYLKISIDEIEALAIDKLNGVYRVQGVDYSASINQMT